MSKAYLVTGGTGFIGAYLVRRLIAQGQRVRVVDNDLRGSRVRLADVLDDIELVQCDVRDVEAMVKASDQMDCVLHLAALNGTENFYKRPQLVLDVSVRGMLAVMDACKRANVPELVVASSSEAYQTPPTIPTGEDVPLMIPDVWNPRYSYGGGKLAAELIAANYYREHFERLMIFRPHNVYGPDMGWEHVLPQLILRAYDRIASHAEDPVPFEVQGDGSQTRSFIYIDDFVDALMVMLERGEHREIYHLGTTEERSIKEIIDSVFAYFGRTPILQPGPLPQGSTLRRCPNIDKITSLGFQQRTTLDDGIKRIADWYVSHQAERPAA